MTEFECNLATVIQELQEARVPKRTIVVRQAAQPIPFNIYAGTPVNFDTIIDDNVNGFNSTDPGKITIKEDGIYSLSANVRWEETPAGVAYAYIFLNGDKAIAGTHNVDINGTGGYILSHSCAICYPLKANDYLELRVNQVLLPQVNILDGPVNFSVVKIGEL